MTDNDRAEVEIAEFSELYPDTELDSIPLSVWESVKEGIKLSDAYGEYEKQRRKEYGKRRTIKRTYKRSAEKGDIHRKRGSRHE